MLFRYSRCAIRCMEMAHNPGDKCGRGLRNEEVPPSTVTVPVLRAYLGRLVDIHVALIYSVPYYTVYTHTHTHTPLAGYLQVRNAASSQWRVAVHELGSKAHLLPSTDYTFNDPIPFEVRRFLRDEGLRHPSFA